MTQFETIEVPIDRPVPVPADLTEPLAGCDLNTVRTNGDMADTLLICRYLVSQANQRLQTIRALGQGENR